MKSFVLIALVAVLASVTIECYGPIRRKRFGGSSHESSATFQPSQGPYGAPQESHDSAQHPHHQSSQDYKRGPPDPRFSISPSWDDSPDWKYLWESNNENGDSDTSSSERSGTHGGYGFRHYRHSTKRPCMQPTKPASTTGFPKTPPHTAHTTSWATVPPDNGNMYFSRPRPTSVASGLTISPTRTVEPSPGTPGISGSSSRPKDDTAHWNTSPPEVITIQTVQRCIELCPTTSEYNPVCGTNGQTYSNEGSLFCAQSCGVDVSIRRRSPCPPPIVETTSGPSSSTTSLPTTSSKVTQRTLSPRDFKYQLCMKQCAITPAITPVCGTDRVTYMNMDRLKCAQSCGADVELLCEKPCVVCGSIRTTPTLTTLLPTTSDIYDRTTTVPVKPECLISCHVTQEYNPVCGSNGITYKNPGHLLCEQMCGIDVAALSFSSCSSPSTISSFATSIATPELTTTTMSPEVLRCVRSCVVTSQYDPVCGTDDITYTNIGRLECAKYCGVDVEFKYKSRCSNEINFENDASDDTMSQSTPSLNRNNDNVNASLRSIATPTSLSASPTTSTAPSSTSSLTTTEAPASEILLGFTIPSDMLKDIFKSNVTQSPSAVKVTNPDDDEDIDIDTRFNNDAKNISDSKIIFRE